MSTFESPTINDFLASVEMQSGRILDRFCRAKSEIESNLARSGRLGSSAQVSLLLDAIDQHIETGVSVLLGELRRALQYPDLDAIELRSLIGPRLDDLTSRIVSASRLNSITRQLQNPQFQEMVDSRIETARGNIQFWLRQFDIGWEMPAEPERLKRPPHSG